MEDDHRKHFKMEMMGLRETVNDTHELWRMTKAIMMNDDFMKGSRHVRPGKPTAAADEDDGQNLISGQNR